MDHWSTIPIMLLIFLVVSVLEIAALVILVRVIWKLTLWMTRNPMPPNVHRQGDKSTESLKG